MGPYERLVAVFAPKGGAMGLGPGTSIRQLRRGFATPRPPLRLQGPTNYKATAGGGKDPRPGRPYWGGIQSREARGEVDVTLLFPGILPDGPPTLGTRLRGTPGVLGVIYYIEYSSHPYRFYRFFGFVVLEYSFHD